MSLVNDVVNQILSGITPKVRFGNWEGSYDGHPHSVTVDNTKSKVEFKGINLEIEFHFTVTTGFALAGAHVLKGVVELPHNTKSIDFDGAAKTGHIILTGHVAGFPPRPRAEILFKWPETGDPGNHFRFDADIVVG